MLKTFEAFRNTEKWHLFNYNLVSVVVLFRWVDKMLSLSESNFTPFRVDPCTYCEPELQFLL